MFSAMYLWLALLSGTCGFLVALMTQHIYTWLTAKGARAPASKKDLKTAEQEYTAAIQDLSKAATTWQFSNVCIHTVEHMDAPQVQTTKEMMRQCSGPLAWLAGIKPDAIERITGIRERRFWPQGTTAVQAATWIADRTLTSAGVDPSRLGVLVNASVLRDHLEPSVAVCVHDALGLPPSCITFDIVDACVGVVTAMGIVANMIDTGAVEYGLVISSEALQMLLQPTAWRLWLSFSKKAWEEKMAMLTLGCAGVGVLMCRADLAPPGHAHKFIGGVSSTASYACGLCTANASMASDDITMTTCTRQMTPGGRAVVDACWRYGCDKLGWSVTGIDLMFPHQISRRLPQHLSEVTGFPIDRIVAVHEDMGNVGPAGIAVALSKADKQGLLKPGMRVMLVATGSGIRAYLAIVEW